MIPIRTLAAFILGIFLTSCAAPATPQPSTALPSQPPPVETVEADPTAALASTQPARDAYGFPETINPSGKYLFYLHGKIVEDQGLPAVSPEFGEYEYEEILERFGSFGSTVISEQRGKDADSNAYARRTASQVRELLAAGVPEKNITIVGASKGAAITILASHQLANPKLNYVLLAICAPEEVQALIDDGATLAGNVLSIYDEADGYAGSCANLFAFSEGKGLERHEEIVLHTGLGHGLLYKPLDEWMLPVILWAGKPGCRCD